MAKRRKAQERLREFNRPPRTGRVRRAGTSQPTAASQALVKAVEGLRTHERRIFFGCNVETGRKKAPDFDAERARRKRMTPSARHALHQQDQQRLPQLTSAAKLQAALQQQEEWTGVKLSQVQRAVTAANKSEKQGLISGAVDAVRHRRRSIQKRVSETRPAAYPEHLQRKRDGKREARRPQIEARRLEREQANAQRAKDVAIAQWAYDTCLADERHAREYNADDLWYLRERRLDAGSALRIARGANESPRWEVPARKRGPVYRRVEEWERLRQSTMDEPDDDEPASPSAPSEPLPLLLAPAAPMPPPQPRPPQPPPPPPTALFHRSFGNLRSRLPSSIDDERLASALRETGGHAGLALEHLGVTLQPR